MGARPRAPKLMKLEFFAIELEFQMCKIRNRQIAPRSHNQFVKSASPLCSACFVDRRAVASKELPA